MIHAMSVVAAQRAEVMAQIGHFYNPGSWVEALLVVGGSLGMPSSPCPSRRRTPTTEKAPRQRGREAGEGRRERGTERDGEGRRGREREGVEGGRGNEGMLGRSARGSNLNSTK